MALDIVFMGTPPFAVSTFEAIRAAGHRVVAAYARAPRASGRGMGERRSAVHVAADAAGVPVLTPRSLRDAEAQAAFAAHGADVAVVVAYGLILPPPVLAAPRLGCLNLHASLLPRWRGAAPIERAVMAGDAETGVAVMQMDEGLDTGAICLEARTPIGAEETAGELRDRLAAIGAALMVEALAAAEAGTLPSRPQPAEGVTYAAKIDKAEARIDWSRPAAEVDARIRGLNPAPGAFTELPGPGAPERLKILAARVVAGIPGAAPGSVLDDALTVACGEGALRLLTVQRAGKGPVDAGAFLNGRKVPAGARFA